MRKTNKHSLLPITLKKGVVGVIVPRLVLQRPVEFRALFVG